MWTGWEITHQVKQKNCAVFNKFDMKPEVNIPLTKGLLWYVMFFEWHTHSNSN